MATTYEVEQSFMGGVPITIFGSADEGAMRQARVCARTGPVARVALMADNHKGYGVPIGGVVAYRDGISPSGVGYDIGCGVKAVKTNMTYNDGAIAPKWERMEILREIKDSIAFGIGQVSKLDKDAVGVMDSPWWSEVPDPIRAMRQKAEAQLGSVGSGNHYIDLLVDDDDTLWVAAHFGSRGFGHGAATHFLRLLGASDEMDSPPAIIDGAKDPRLLDEYLWTMTLAGEYARAGRDLVVGKVLDILGAKALDTVHNHHNYAWSEDHDGEVLWVVRKGATPAAPGQRGFVGGSMADDAFIVVGADTPAAEQSMRSTVHGAGRLMGRMQAKGKTKYDKATKTRMVVREPGVDKTEHDALIAEWDVIVLGGDLDESPFAYRKLRPVIDAQGDSITVETRLRPIAVAMADPRDQDPYRD